MFIIRFLTNIDNWTWWAIALVIIATWQYIKATEDAPTLRETDILYEERSASGVREYNGWAYLRSNFGPLRIVVTRDILWLTAPTFLTLLCILKYMWHVIPRTAITEILRPTEFEGLAVIITYTDKKGSPETIRLFPKHPEQLLTSLGVQPNTCDENLVHKPLQ